MGDELTEKIVFHNKLLLGVVFFLILLLGLIVINKGVIYNKTYLQCPVCNQSVLMSECANETEVVTLVVCEDGRVVGELSECSLAFHDVTYEPVTSNQEGTLITEFKVEPACINGNKGGSIYYEVKSPADSVEFQVKQPGGEYGVMLEQKGLFYAYRKFTICGKKCPWGGDFGLKENSTHVLRIGFVRSSFNRTEYTNEYVIDLNPGSEFMEKSC